MAGAIFSTLAYSDPAFAAKQLADASAGDNRGLALLLPIIPAITLGALQHPRTSS